MLNPVGYVTFERGRRGGNLSARQRQSLFDHVDGPVVCITIRNIRSGQARTLAQVTASTGVGTQIDNEQNVMYDS